MLKDIAIVIMIGWLWGCLAVLTYIPPGVHMIAEGLGFSIIQIGAGIATLIGRRRDPRRLSRAVFATCIAGAVMFGIAATQLRPNR